MKPFVVTALLRELCVDLGFCLPPDGRLRLENNPPADIDDFTDAVFVEEGMDPNLNRHLRRQVRERVKRHFDKFRPDDA